MSDPTSQSSPSEAPQQQSEASAPPAGEASDAPKKRRRRRRRGGKGKSPTATPPATSTGPVAADAGAGPGLDPGLAALAGGLLSHVDDREVPCAAGNCNKTWTWTAAEQIQAYGQPAPRRECAACGKTAATEVRCSVESCKRTWTWTKEAQLKHKGWARKRGSNEGGRRRRRGEGTPRRKCELCHKKHARLEERASACKVHGCTRPVTLDRDSQLRAWAALATTDLEAEGSLPKHMCDVCREFCRTRDDRKVPCGRPGCERTWMYKRGAQLQAFLAGRFEDPLRLCGKCEGEARNASVRDPRGARIPANIEIMPCIVPGCPNNWHFRHGAKVPACNDGDQPVERMCDEHRVKHGAAPRDAAASPAAEAEATPDADTESGSADQSGAEQIAPASAEVPGAGADTAPPTEVSTEESSDGDSAIS